MDIEQLKAVGGSEWRSGDGAKHRVYFSDLTIWRGLRAEYYNSGRVHRATCGGERISNTDANAMIGRLAGAKVYYDVADAKFRGDRIGRDDFSEIVQAIRAKLARMAVQVPAAFLAS